MAKSNFVKIIVFSLVWATFLSLLITNWNALKSARWQDFTDAVTSTGITQFLKQNSDDLFFFGLCATCMILLLSIFSDKKDWLRKRDSKRDVNFSSLKTGADEREITDPAGRIIVRGPEIDISIDPGLTSMPSNVYHRWYADHQPKRDDS